MFEFFNGPFLRFYPRIAASIGLNEALILEWFLEEFPKDKPNLVIHQNKKYLKISIYELSKSFPFWNIRTINRIIKSLKEKDLLISEQSLSENPLDRTNFYTINQQKLEQLYN